MSDPYVDPLIKYLGAGIILVLVMAVLLAASYYLFVYQIDHSTDYCHDTKTYVQIKECRGVR